MKVDEHVARERVCRGRRRPARPRSWSWPKSTPVVRPADSSRGSGSSRSASSGHRRNPWSGSSRFSSKLTRSPSARRSCEKRPSRARRLAVHAKCMSRTLRIASIVSPTVAPRMTRWTTLPPCVRQERRSRSRPKLDAFDECDDCDRVVLVRPVHHRMAERPCHRDGSPRQPRQYGPRNADVVCGGTTTRGSVSTRSPGGAVRIPARRVLRASRHVAAPLRASARDRHRTPGSGPVVEPARRSNSMLRSISSSAPRSTMLACPSATTTAPEHVSCRWYCNTTTWRSSTDVAWELPTTRA